MRLNSAWDLADSKMSRYTIQIYLVVFMTDKDAINQLIILFL